MKIKLTSVYVDDQEKALRFYTEVLGFAKKADFSQGPYRWLTVASPEDPDGTELQLALNDNPAAKAIRARIDPGVSTRRRQETPGGPGPTKPRPPDLLRAIKQGPLTNAAMEHYSWQLTLE